VDIFIVDKNSQTGYNVSMTLNEYCKTFGLKNLEIAKYTGVCMVSVSRYRNNKRIPRPDIMAKISALTNNKVTADDFYDLEEGE
jgi:transcriptional regulator with XRE-family HTH domain